MRHALFLALRYLRSAPARSLVLMLGTAVALFLPLFSWRAAVVIEDGLLDRADASPILLGHKGNEFDLTMNALYFEGAVRDPIPYAAVTGVLARDYGRAVPLYVKYSASGAPVVGTSLDYFELRGLALASGRFPALLGEVVVGDGVARDFNLDVGDSIRSDLTNLYNIAGAYPLQLQVVGILGEAGGPDDQAVFADVKTAWVLDGSLHGHESVTEDNALPVASEDPANLEATAAIFMFSEITDANRQSFHLHGGPDAMPLSSVLVFPRDARAHDQLLGDYALEETLQAVIPTQVVRTILGIVLQVREVMNLAWIAIAGSTLLFFGLVLDLSRRLRADEIQLMRRIGSSRGTVARVLGAEVALVVAGAIGLALLATWGGLQLLEAGLGVG